MDDRASCSGERVRDITVTRSVQRYLSWSLFSGGRGEEPYFFNSQVLSRSIILFLEIVTFSFYLLISLTLHDETNIITQLIEELIYQEKKSTLT